jgi:hypothetical protein
VLAWLRADAGSAAVVPAGLAVTGLVFDVRTGRVHLAERRSPLRG